MAVERSDVYIKYLPWACIIKYSSYHIVLLPQTKQEERDTRKLWEVLDRSITLTLFFTFHNGRFFFNVFSIYLLFYLSRITIFLILGIFE